MKFLVHNYSCLQNPWLGGYRPHIPFLSILCPQLNLLTPLPPKKILGYAATHNVYYLLLFHSNSGCTHAPQYYVLRMLPILLVLISNLRWRLEIHASRIVGHCYQSWDSCVKRKSLSVELCPVRCKQVLLTVSRENWNVVSPAVLMLLMISY